MKKSNGSIIRNISYYLFMLGFVFFFMACNSSPTEVKTNDTGVVKADNIYWNVKAIHPDGQTLDIKAFDEEGNALDIKAIKNGDQDGYLDVKAIGNGRELPIKMLESDDQYAPVKAIESEGVLYDVKAVTAAGEKLDVKGITRVGNIILMKAISKEGDFYGVKAISPTGQMNDLKGIKLNAKKREMVLKGFKVLAHVKAMHQSADENQFDLLPNFKGKYVSKFEKIIWNVKAVTPEGTNLDIKAVDEKGNKFDVKAIQDSKQHSFMNIKAYVEGYELPVKIMNTSDEYAPVSAIRKGGKTYELKAITADGVALDIKGVARSGNVIHVKAITENGDFYGVKAFAPDGKLNDVKGVKIFDRKIELTMYEIEVYAHLKAISQ